MEHNTCVRAAFLLLVLAGIASGQELKVWKFSVAALAAANAADAHSSWGKPELNPILGRGEFGPRELGVKSGIVISAILVQKIVIKKHPKYAKIFSAVNFGNSAVFTGVALRNYRIAGP